MLPFLSRRIDDVGSRQVIAALEAVGDGRSTVVLPAMSASFRDELRTQLVAVTPRLVAEGVRPGTETAPQEAPKARRSPAAVAEPPARAATRSRSRARTRPMTVLVAGVAVVVLALGGATWLARGALPGDALYGLKRTAESVDVSLAGSDIDKGHALLNAATNRVDEVNSLVSRPQSMAFGTGSAAAGTLSASTVELIVTTLTTADTDTQKGVATIVDDAVRTGHTNGLAIVAEWAGGTNGQGGQTGRIDALVRRVPDGPAHKGAEASRDNIIAAYQRAKDLLPEIENGTTCARDRDQFGQEPCGAAAPATTTPTRPSSSPTSGNTGPTGPPASTPGGGTGTPTSAPTPSATPTRTSSGSTPGGAGSSGASLPGVSAPVSVDSCGVQVTLPIGGVSLGTCTPSR